MKQKNVILMVVAVGCGLVAAFLTSQMSAKQTVETVDVLVAAKDLPVGTMITRDDLDKVVKVKKLPKDGLPPAYVIDKETLVDKRLSRPLRAEETFNPQDLLKGGAITLPAGYNMVSFPVGAGQAAAGFVGPGSRVDVLATLRLTSKLHSFKLLTNMLVVAVNTATTYDPNNGGAFPNVSMVSFAVKEKEALLLSLARSRGCQLELMLRHPESSDPNETNDKIDDILKLLSDEKINDKSSIVSNSNDKDKDKENPKPGTKTTDTKDPGATVTPVKPEPVPAAPTIPVLKVLVAKFDIAPNTTVTGDLIKEAFEWKEVPKENAEDALVQSNYENALGQAFKTGVSKNQWVTWTMVGLPTPKAKPPEHFDPRTIPANPEVKPPVEVKPPAVKYNYHDVAVTTPHGTTIHRYKEVKPGQWKKYAELTPEQAARDPNEEPAPKGAPDAKKVD